MNYRLSTFSSALLLLALGCSPDTENVFGSSPAERQQQAAERYASILEGQQSGWSLDFYPSELELGGIAYTAQFADGKATLACEQPINNSAVNGQFKAAQPVTSDYRIVNGRGVVLTFDTYNALLHYWSQPSGTDYDGYASDYEFTFVSASPDSVILRGVKHGNLLRMYPLKEPSADYLQKVADMRTELSPITRKRLAVDGSPVDIPLTMMESHFQYTTDSTIHTVPYVYTPAGLRLYAPVTIGGATLFELQLDNASQSLRSPDGRVELPMPTALERFCAASTQWHLSFGRTDESYEMCEDMRTLTKRTASMLSRQRFETLTDVYIGMNKLPRTEDEQRIVMGWTSSYASWAYEVCHGISMTVSDEQQSLIDIKATESGNLFYNYAAFVAPMLAFVTDNSPYRLEFDNPNTPTTIRLTSADDPTKWFVLKTK